MALIISAVARWMVMLPHSKKDDEVAHAGLPGRWTIRLPVAALKEKDQRHDTDRFYAVSANYSTMK